MNKDFEKWILDGGNYPLIFTKMPSFVKEVDGKLCLDENISGKISPTQEITINQKMKEWILNSGISEEFSGYHLIPEELIKEREKLLHFDTQNQNIDDLIHEHNIFLKCFLRNEGGYNDTYNQKFIDHLNSELNIYR